MDGALDVSGRYCTAHLAHGGNPTGSRMDSLGPDSKRDHRHMDHRPDRDPVEGGGGADRHPFTRKPPVVFLPIMFHGRKSNGESYNGIEASSRALQHRPSPPLTSIPGPKEGL